MQVSQKVGRGLVDPVAVVVCDSASRNVILGSAAKLLQVGQTRSQPPDAADNVKTWLAVH